MRRLVTCAIVAIVAAGPLLDAAMAPVASSIPYLAQQGRPSEPLVIVTNRSNPVDKLSFAELRSIFLGNRTYWPNGRRITLVMRDSEDPERKAILREVCGMNDSQFKALFIHGLYTGEILISPKTLSTPAGVRKFIFNVPGAIGYLRISEMDDSVKPVRIDERMPADKGYRLRVQDQAAN